MDHNLAPFRSRLLSAMAIGALLATAPLPVYPADPRTCDGLELGIAGKYVRVETGFVTQAEWKAFCEGIEQALRRHLFDDFAWSMPPADLAAAYLDSVPEGALFMAELEAIGRLNSAVPAARLPPLHPEITGEDAAVGKGRTAPYRWSRPYWLPRELSRCRQPLFGNIAFWKRRVAPFAFPEEMCPLFPRLKAIFNEIGVPPELVWLVEVESAFDVDARSENGARGLFQFMPETALRFGLKVRAPDERIEPEKAAAAAARYLKALYAEFGAWDLALAAYNAGDGVVRRLVKRERTRTFTEAIPYLPEQTQVYVMRVLATVAVREQCDPADLPPPADDSPH